MAVGRENTGPAPPTPAIMMEAWCAAPRFSAAMSRPSVRFSSEAPFLRDEEQQRIPGREREREVLRLCGCHKTGATSVLCGFFTAFRYGSLQLYIYIYFTFFLRKK